VTIIAHIHDRILEHILDHIPDRTLESILEDDHILENILEDDHIPENILEDDQNQDVDQIDYLIPIHYAEEMSNVTLTQIEISAQKLDI